jgi:lipoprotein-releasing system permease protein
VPDAARVLRDKLVAIDAHVSVLKNADRFVEYRDALTTIEKNPDVVAAEPFVYAEVLVASASHAPIATSVKGVDPQRVGRVLDLGAHMTAGKIEDLASGEPPAIILGDVLAGTLHVHVGDLVTVTPQLGTGVAVAPVGGDYSFRVTGTLHVGFELYDHQAYASLAAVQNVLHRGDNVMGIELRVRAIDQSAKVAKDIEQAIGGPPYVVIDWYERNRKLLTTQFGDVRP